MEQNTQVFGFAIRPVSKESSLIPMETLMKEAGRPISCVAKEPIRMQMVPNMLASGFTE